MVHLHDRLRRLIPEPDRIAPIWAIWLPLAAAVALAVYGQLAPRSYAIWVGSEERGVLELAHGLIPLAAFLVALRLLFLPRVRSEHLLMGWVALVGLGALYIAGEETSWGQHYLGWSTPEYWQALNDQGETNLHNVSSWFDQKPRALLEIAIIVGGLILPWAVALRPRLRAWRFAIIIPALSCFPTAFLAEFSAFSHRVVRWSGSQDYLFTRTSEVQELYFYYFVLLYLVVLRRRLRSEPAKRAEAGPGQEARQQRSNTL